MCKLFIPPCMLDHGRTGAQLPMTFYWHARWGLKADVMKWEYGLGSLHPSARAQTTLWIMGLLISLSRAVLLYMIWSHINHFSSKGSTCCIDTSQIVRHRHMKPPKFLAVSWKLPVHSKHSNIPTKKKVLILWNMEGYISACYMFGLPTLR